jgi:hypothetical protein
MVTEVAYALNDPGQEATGILTFQDILVCEQVAELLEDKALTLATQTGQRWSFVMADDMDGSTPVLSIQLTGSAQS